MLHLCDISSVCNIYLFFVNASSIEKANLHRIKEGLNISNSATKYQQIIYYHLNLSSIQNSLVKYLDQPVQ